MHSEILDILDILPHFIKEKGVAMSKIQHFLVYTLRFAKFHYLPNFSFCKRAELACSKLTYSNQELREPASHHKLLVFNTFPYISICTDIC